MFTENDCKKHMVLKVIGGLVVLALVFGGGVAVGSEFGHRGERNGRLGMMGYQAFGNEKSFMGSNMMYRAFGDGEEGEKNGRTTLFGTVVKVEGNKITFTDNAAKEQTVLSQTNTVIFTSAGEVGLSSLKAGQNIVVTQMTDKNNQTQVEEIDVM